MTENQGAQIRRRSLFAVFLTIFLDLVGFGMFIPILVTVASDLGAGPAGAAAINTWHSIGTLLSVVVLGRLSDRFGRKPVLIATIALSAATQLATGYAGTLGVLVAMRFLAGVAAGNISVAQACITDVTPPSRRASSMAIIGIAFGAGFALGPALGALISRWAGDHFLPAVGWTSFALNIINLVFVSRRLVETHPKLRSAAVHSALTEDPIEITTPSSRAEATGSSNPTQAPLGLVGDFAKLVQVRPLRILFLMQFLQVFGFVGLETVLPLVLRDDYGFDKRHTYDAFVILGLAVLLCNGLLARRLLLRISENTAIKYGQFLLCAGIAAVHLVAPNAFPLYAALTVIACGTSFTNPAISSLTSKLCPREQLGMTFGALQFVGTAARILGPLGMGVLYEMTGGSRSLWGTVVFIALASLIAWRLPRSTGTQTP